MDSKWAQVLKSNKMIYVHGRLKIVEKHWSIIGIIRWQSRNIYAIILTFAYVPKLHNGNGWKQFLLDI